MSTLSILCSIIPSSSLLPFPPFCQVMGGLPSESSVGVLNILSTRHLTNIILLYISTCKEKKYKREPGWVYSILKMSLFRPDQTQACWHQTGKAGRWLGNNPRWGKMKSGKKELKGAFLSETQCSYTLPREGAQVLSTMACKQSHNSGKDFAVLA